jgi:hypothetical protein
MTTITVPAVLADDGAGLQSVSPDAPIDAENPGSFGRAYRAPEHSSQPSKAVIFLKSAH